MRDAAIALIEARVDSLLMEQEELGLRLKLAWDGTRVFEARLDAVNRNITRLRQELDALSREDAQRAAVSAAVEALALACTTPCGQCAPTAPTEVVRAASLAVQRR